MMKKATSALAIAAMIGSGAATAATFQIDDDTTFGVSGRVSPYMTDVETISAATTVSGTTFSHNGDDEVTAEADDSTAAILSTRGVSSESTFSDTSRAIFSGNHTLNNGLNAFVNMELRQLGNTSNDGKSSSNVEARNAFIGMESDAFGRLSFGRQATVYKKAIGGYQDITYFGGTSLAANVTNNRNLQYSTPSLGGLTVHAGAQVNGDSQKADANSSSSSLSGALVYEGPGFTLSASYDQAEYINRSAQGVDFIETDAELQDTSRVGGGEAQAYEHVILDQAGVQAYNDLATANQPVIFNANAAQGAGTAAAVGGADDLYYQSAIAADTSEEAIYGLAAETTIAGLNVAAFYQVDGSQNQTNEIDTLGLNVGYSVGDLALTALVQSIDSQVAELNVDGTVNDNPGSRTEMFLQGVYSMSDQFVLVGEYAVQDKQEDVGDRFNVGAVYNF